MLFLCIIFRKSEEKDRFCSSKIQSKKEENTEEKKMLCLLHFHQNRRQGGKGLLCFLRASEVEDEYCLLYSDVPKEGGSP